MEGKNRMEQGNVLDGLHEECGVFGIYDFDGGNVASSVYYGLLALQHRGQESCGIAVGDTDGPRKVTNSPLFTSRLKSSTALNPLSLYTLLICLNSIILSAIVLLLHLLLNLLIQHVCLITSICYFNNYT